MSAEASERGDKMLSYEMASAHRSTDAARNAVFVEAARGRRKWTPTQHESEVSMRILAVVIGCVLLGFACAPTYVILPADGGNVGANAAGGLTLYADANAWQGRPEDLSEYLLPIWIDIINQSQNDARINYADFALLDSRGFRYAAINPYTGRATPEPSAPSTAPGGESDPPAETRAAEAAPLDAHLGRPVGPQTEPWRNSGHSVVQGSDPPRRGRGAPRTFRGRHGHFYVHPRRHVFFHFYGPWPYYYYWPPYYTTYVYTWGWPYYPGPPSNDVLRLGLPEGVVKTGGRVDGFVYFQNAVARGPTGLRLVFSPRTPEGKNLPQLSIPFVMVED